MSDHLADGESGPAAGPGVLAMITDPAGRLAFANPHLLALAGWSWEEVSGRPWHEALVPSEHRDGVAEAFDTAVRSPSGAGCVEAPFLDAHGRIRTIAWSVTHALGESGDGETVTCVGVDVTRWTDERERIVAQTEYAASHDRLTGLPNSEAFTAGLAAALAAAEPAGECTGVLLIRLDRVRAMVETLGHEAGERLKAEMALRVRDCVDTMVDRGRARVAGRGATSDLPEAFLARWSDNQFAIFLPRLASPEEALELARGIAGAVAMPCTSCAAELHMGAVIGTAIAPEDGGDPAMLMRHAAMAQHRAQISGERVVRFQAALSDEAQDRLLVEQQLHGAIDRGEVSVVFQPQVDAATLRVVGLEALARWHHPVLGELPPSRFIPLAEEIGIIRDIGRFVLRSALRQAQEWRSEGLGQVSVAVNVSAYQLVDHSLVDDVVGCLRETGTDPQSLELEVTESAALADSASASVVLRELAGLGVTISLDDFGTGYSNLGKLHQLAISTIKIDRSFLLDPTFPVADPSALLRALIALGRSLGLRVIAEGVETEEQFDRLRPEGLDAYQGFLFSRPVAGREVRRLLLEGRPLRAPTAFLAG
jgi:diguanylate cyclase (GGDEF)-like protein/PAS domain S-box-containing protein